jgi:sugar (pentulose or hexulose) kinase
VIAIFDIGKTNKKFFVFDDRYQIIFEDSLVFDEIKDEDGFPCEDIQAISRWVLATFSHAVANNAFQIKAVNFSAHGASLVHLNACGQLIAPLYNYFKPVPERLQNKFNLSYSIETICRETSSPELGNLNSGKQLYGLKHDKPDVFNKIRWSLHLPEYFTWLLTGKVASGLTSIGCHTMLWDFQKNNYHSWVIQEGLGNKLAPLQPSDKHIPFTQDGRVFTCGLGLHDSSAALIPYLKNQQAPFVLLSTGTWNISLNPFNDSPLTQTELNQDCLCYLTYTGNQVKASRLLAGKWYEEKVNLLTDKYHLDASYFNVLATEGVTVNNEADQAYYQLMSELVALQKQSTDLILTNSGFAKNRLFIELLSKAYPKMIIEAASWPQASALGAAMIM